MQSVVAGESPLSEFGVGDLTIGERIVLHAFNKDVSFAVLSPFELGNLPIITAMIGQAACQNESILLLSGRKGSLGALKNNLARYGLESLMFDAWTTPANSANFMKVLQKVHERPALNAAGVDVTITRELDANMQDIVDQYALFQHRYAPFNVSFSDIIDEFLTLKNYPKFDVQLSRDTAIAIQGNFDAYTGEIANLIALENNDKTNETILSSVASASSEAPLWDYAIIESHSQIADLITRLERLQDITLPALKLYIAEICDATNLIKPETFSEWCEMADLMSAIRKTLDVFSNEVFQRDLEPYIAATDSTQKHSDIGFFEKGRLVKEVKELLRPGQYVENLHSALSDVAWQRDFWLELKITNQSLPEVIASKCVINLPSSVLKAVNLTRSLVNDFEALNAVFEGSDEVQNFLKMSFEDFDVALINMMDNRDKLFLLPERLALLKQLEGIGLNHFAAAASNANLQSSEIPLVLRKVWLSSVLELLKEGEPDLQKLTSRRFLKALSDFRKLDLDHVNTLKMPVKYFAGQQQTLAINSFPDLNKCNPSDFVNAYFSAIAMPIPTSSNTAENNAELLPEEIDTLVLEHTDDYDVNSLREIISRAKKVVVFGNSLEPPQDLLNIIGKNPEQFTISDHFATRDLRLTRLIQNNGYQNAVVSNMKFPVAQSVEFITSASQFLINFVKNGSGEINVVGHSDDIIDLRQNLAKKLQNDAELLGLFQKFEHDADNAIRMCNIESGTLISADKSLLLFTERLAETADDAWTNFFLAASGKVYVTTNSDAKIRDENLQNLWDLLKEIADEPLDVLTAHQLFHFVPQVDLDPALKLLAGQLRQLSYNVQENYALSANSGPHIDLAVTDADGNGVAVILDAKCLKMPFDKVLRKPFRHNLEVLERLGWKPIIISKLGIYENTSLEIARVVDAFAPANSFIPASERAKAHNSNNNARANEILREKPPHWG